MLAFQTVNVKEPNRKAHVWTRTGDRWKCVLCGGVSATPTSNGLLEKFEALTDQERALCPRPRTD